MKDELVEIPQFIQHNDDEYTFRNDVVQEVSGILEQNKREREASDGFSENRTMRKVMSLSTVDYLNALQLGYALDTTDPQLLKKEVYRYLQERGRDEGYQTVSSLYNPFRSPNIIIK